MAVNINKKVKATANVKVRKTPSLSGKEIDLINEGEEYTATKVSTTWFYIKEKGGWSSNQYFDIVEELDESKSSSVDKEEAKIILDKQAKKEAEMQYYNDEILNQYKRTSNIEKTLLVSNLAGIHGIPYQFMSSVDRKIGKTSFGRVYADKIVAKMPLLMVSPGRAAYMTKFKKSEKAFVLESLIEGADGLALNKILTNTGRYYTFEFDYASYYKYVNGMCRSSAVFLGLQDVVVNVGGNKQKLGNFNWEKSVNDKVNGVFSNKEYVSFYVDSASQVDESFTNNTTESMLSSKVNSFSELGREVSFLLGAGAGVEVDMLSQDEDKFASTLEQIDEISNKYLNGNQLFKDIANNFATVATGGKLLFPEIWSDSEYSKTYDINMKLRTPDGDKLSWYMNICVPLCHIIPLAAAQQMSPNGYKAPFLVRAFYKGLFNCDMGIVSSLSITKGKEGAWTIDGLPTEVDISMQIKDLYNMFMITQGNKYGWFLNNTALMNYLANNCGVNINKMDIERDMEIYLMLRYNQLTDPATSGIWTGIQQQMSNLAIQNYYQ